MEDIKAQYKFLCIRVISVPVINCFGILYINYCNNGRHPVIGFDVQPRVIFNVTL
jgi:hypothetical protein